MAPIDKLTQYPIMTDTMKTSDALREAMMADPRSLNQLARDCGIDVSTLCRFSHRQRTLSQAASDALAAALGLELVAKQPARAKKRTTKPKGR